jgi:urease accessory protein
MLVPRHQRAHGTAELGFGLTPRGTVLKHLFHAAPLRVLFPTPEPGEAPTAVLINVGGGLAGGDSLAVNVTLGDATAASVTTPAAEKVYRALGDDTRVETRLEVGAGATLEWLPQETILFEGARLERRMHAALAPGARLLAAEMLVFGRVARGEQLTRGGLFDAWRIRRDGRLLWADATALDGDIAARLAAAFGFGQAEASGLLLLAADGAEALAGRDILRAAGFDATLARPGLLLARFLGGATPVRDAMARAIPLLRASVLGWPARLPRLWTS